MRANSRFVVIMALVAVVAAAAPAGAQMRAGENPTVRGPLNRRGGDCDGDRVGPDGVVAVALRSCTDWYAFDPDRENNPNKDFDVVWLQTTVDAQNGYCAKEVRSIVRVPRGSRIIKRAPRFHRIDSHERMVTKLVATAGGAADDNAVVRNGYGVYPRSIRPELDGRKLTLTWKGNTARPLAFAVGVEISFDADDIPAGAPSGLVDADLAAC
ncbi:MAG: hypothetical protein M3280_05245 [Actinomycetota bacterium]|nr:hypothetical protein [Actinomycetota bacterium]